MIGDDSLLVQIGRSLILGLTIASASQTDAQELPNSATNSESPTIVVTGTRLSPEEAHRTATEFVRQIGVAAGERPVARWVDPICPRAIGIAPVYAKLVEKKVRSVAREADVRVANASCRPNIAITFTFEAGDLVSKIAARTPARFANVSPLALQDLRNGPAPIR